MIEHRHELFLASAGTGKTFQLTNHFLRLLFDGVPPERILATTFTRKAAGEILDRVLERLVEGARGGDGLAQLAHFVARPGLSAGECVRLLGGLTRAIDRFQVRTIDAFFVQLANLFALDLELPPDWSIVDEREDLELRDEAVASVLGDGDKAERLELLRGLRAGAAPSRVHDEVLSQLDEGRDLYLESSEEAWSRVRSVGKLEPKALDAALGNLRSAELPRKKNGDPDTRFEKALAAVLNAVANEDWSVLVDKGLGRAVLDCSCAYYGIPFSDSLVESLTPVVAHAVGHLVEEIAQRNAALCELLRRFEERYQQLKRSRGAYRFDDLPLALAGSAQANNPLEERELDLWFRLDGRLDHLLLDEFQDTAPLQWRILAPVAEEVLADGTGERSFFCVGDTKQSIYGWRKAEPRLLAGLAAKYPVLEETYMT
ncbi:MAG: UvrD-helicase domain-containing protein, partial [Planctomycetes bacterium]|nr:UvrD-helicase domain-containing protein [Planctomycetota bacterium]